LDVAQGKNHKPKPYRVALLWQNKLPTILVPFSEEEEKKKSGQRQIGTNQFKSVQLLASSCSQYFGGAYYILESTGQYHYG